MQVEIKRNFYLNRLVQQKHDGFVKVITGLRRCGKSYLLRTLFRNHLLASGVTRDHIIEMSFDLYENMPFRKAELFYAWVTRQLSEEGMYYILLDEVQMLEEFVSILNSLAARPNCDVYVTGSNAKFLSKDIATEFGGRSIEIHLSPLSFSEFMSVFSGDERQGLAAYLRYGGLPAVVLKDDDRTKREALKALINETYVRDVISRNNIQHDAELKTLLRVLASCVGGLTNPNKLKNTFQTNEHSNISVITLGKYLEFLQDAFLVDEVRRYDIKGRTYIGTPMKYYFSDMGLCNSLLDFRQDEVAHQMENVIYNELRRRGFEVDVGNLKVAEHNPTGTYSNKFVEIDFVCRRASEQYYIQVAYTIGSAEKARQELRPFTRISDAFRKIVITMDTLSPYFTEEGIYVMSIFDFFRNQESLISF